MPLYEYECESCGVRFEVIQKFADGPIATCKACGGKVQRLLSAPAIQFKGSGWYITDYARKGSGGEKSTSSPAGAAASKAGETNGSSPSKPATADATPSSEKKSDKN